MLRKVFGAMLVSVLLILYVVTVILMIRATLSCGPNGATGANECLAKWGINPGFEYVVTTVGGLVSALVVSVLAITKSGERLGARLVDANAGKATTIAADVIVVIYLAVWGLAGLAALIVGAMIYPNVYTTLATIGTTWLGLAVAAGYAYFGIQPD